MPQDTDTGQSLVIVTHTLPESWMATLAGKCQMITGPVNATCLAPWLEEALPHARGIFSLLTIPITTELLARAPHLRVVSNMAVGVDNVDIAACTERGIAVGNTPGVLTEATADLTMALLLSLARNLPQASQDAREGRWQTWAPAGWLGVDLSGASLGILGFGKIGRAVAGRARAFGMKLLYHDPTPQPAFAAALDAKWVGMDELLSTSDILTLHTPLTEETRGLIGEAALKTMKPTAMLINAARGPIVQMDALARALQEGWIAAAALDVTDPEPLPPTHPLFRLPNCLIVPHIGSATQNTRRRMAELACENLLAGLEGRRLPNCVNPEVYDR